MQRLKIVFRKGEGARYLSHLDLMATFEYAIRRARLPVDLSEGFNPRPRMSLAAPLPLGYTGEREILEITLRSIVETPEVRERLQRALPAGVSISSVEEVPAGRRTSASRLRSAVYRIELPTPAPDLQSRVDELLNRSTLPVEEHREGTVRRRDLRPLLGSLESTPSGDGLRLVVRLDSEGTARPEQILDLLSVPRDGARITRERIELNDQ